MPELPTGTVTFLFTDIEGSTSLVQRLGDRYGRLLDDHRRLLRAAVEEAGGVEIDCRADEFFGGFADAQGAVRAAVSAQRAFKIHQWPGNLQPAVRMGIHTGEPAVADQGYLGLDVHRAARICAVANGGQVLTSKATRDPLRRADLAGVGFKDLGEHALKGLTQPERLFQLVADGLRSEFPPLRAADTGADEPRPFEGREHQLAAAAYAAVGRLRQAVASLRGTPSTPGLEELGWAVRALLPAAPAADQRRLAELGGVLFTSGRSVVEADRYLRTLDRDSLERRLLEYRAKGVVSKRAAREVDAIESRVAHIDRLAARRKGVEKTTSELAAGIRSLSEHILNRQASSSSDLSSKVATLRVRAQAADLDDALAAARGQLGLMELKLRRTRFRGVFRHGDRYVVPYYDEVGVEHRKEFQTRKEARSFRWTVRFAQKQKSEYSGPSYSSAELTGGGGGM
jgi:class 3 adenylate cyclase